MGPECGTDTQPDPRINTTAYDEEFDGEEYHASLRGHTKEDRADMARMGKVQELRRNYRPLSALAFTVILQGTWEVLMT
jgi:choline transport protein